jgi:MFS family permease
LTRRQLLAAINRTVGYAITGYISALLGHQRSKALSFGLEAGLLIGLVTVLSSACIPFVEWMADHVPAKRMGVVGIGLILTGFALQSVQYWFTLLDVTIR